MRAALMREHICTDGSLPAESPTVVEEGGGSPAGGRSPTFHRHNTSSPSFRRSRSAGVTGAHGAAVGGVAGVGVAASGVPAPVIVANELANEKHAEAALKIQKRVRGHLVRAKIKERLDRAVAPPNLKRAIEHAESLLPHDQAGRQLPLSCPIKCFQVFGAGVYTYMLFVRTMRTVFLVAFVLSLANMIYNTTGGELHEVGLFPPLPPPHLTTTTYRTPPTYTFTSTPSVSHSHTSHTCHTPILPCTFHFSVHLVTHRLIPILYSYAAFVHSIRTLDAYTLFLHSLPTLYSYTLFLHSLSTLYAYTLFLHSIPTLYSYTLCLHSMPTLYSYTIPTLYLYTLFVHSLPTPHFDEQAHFITATSLGNVRELNSSYGAVEVLVSGVLVVALFYNYQMVTREEEDGRGAARDADGGGAGSTSPAGAPTNPAHAPTQADHTLLVSGLPPSATDRDELIRWFSEYGEVTHAVIALANRELLQRMPERRRLLSVLHTAQASYFLARHGGGDGEGGRASSNWSMASIFSSRTQLEEAQRQRQIHKLSALRLKVEEAAVELAAHDAASHAVVRRRHVGTGYAFVSFETPEEARAALSALRVKNFSRRYSGSNVRLRARRAPEPSDVIWENLEFSWRERFKRQAASTAIMLCIASFGTAIIATVAYLQGEELPSFSEHHWGECSDTWSCLRAWVYGTLFNLAMAVPVIFGNLILFISVPQLADKLERHHSFSAKEQSMMLKMTFFQVCASQIE